MSLIAHAIGAAERDRPLPQRPFTVVATLIVWHRRHRTRQQLCRLDRRELEDIGIDAMARRREVAKWFWEP